MNAARLSDGVLPRTKVLALLDTLEQSPQGRPADLLVRDFAALHPGSWSKTRSTVTTLVQHGILAETKGVVRIATQDPLFQSDRVAFFGRFAASILAERIAESPAGRCLQAKDADGELWVDSMCIPTTFAGLPLWLVEFEVAKRDKVGARFWRVSEAYEAVFLESLRQSNRRQTPKGMTALQLAQKLKQNSLSGKEAEDWVVEFERQRLAGHRFLDQVRRVSDENVQEGYDIVSFSSTKALHHDLFIEVKSFATTKRFFWSRNEIAVAEGIGEEYCLYLVDRDRMLDDGYVPQMIRGPSLSMFLLDGSGWEVEANSFEFRELPNN